MAPRAARPVAVGSAYPARELCSRCGLCDTPFIGHVAQACAFLGDGMARIDAAEALAHGRARRLDEEDELYFGVHTELSGVRMREPLAGAAWTGVVSAIAIEALESGLVDAVIAVGARAEDGPARMEPRPQLCRTAAQIRACAGVKPVLANSLELLDAVRADASIRSLLFVGVGCQVQALRAVEAHLGLDALYVLGTNCADNVRSSGALRRFMSAVSTSPDTAIGFEFMQVRSACAEARRRARAREAVKAGHLSRDGRKAAVRAQDARKRTRCRPRRPHCMCPPAVRPVARAVARGVTDAAGLCGARQARAGACRHGRAGRASRARRLGACCALRACARLLTATVRPQGRDCRFVHIVFRLLERAR